MRARGAAVGAAGGLRGGALLIVVHSIPLNRMREAPRRPQLPRGGDVAATCLFGRAGRRGVE